MSGLYKEHIKNVWEFTQIIFCQVRQPGQEMVLQVCFRGDTPKAAAGHC